jgi:hypothetical protein
MNEQLYLQRKIDKTRNFRRIIVSAGIVIIAVGIIAIIGRFVVAQIDVFSQYSKISHDVKQNVATLNDLIANAKDSIENSDVEHKSLDEFRSLDESMSNAKQMSDSSVQMFNKYKFGTLEANSELSLYRDRIQYQIAKLTRNLQIVEDRKALEAFKSKWADFEADVTEAARIFEESRYRIQESYRNELYAVLDEAQKFVEDSTDKINDPNQKDIISAQMDDLTKQLDPVKTKVQDELNRVNQYRGYGYTTTTDSDYNSNKR